MEQIIYNNVSLHYIIDTITNGTIGLSDEDYLDDIIIRKNPEVINNLFDNIFIKPFIVDIAQNVLQFINETKLKVEDIETEFVDFVVFTTAQDEDTTNMVLINKSLSEYLLMISNSGYNLSDILQLQIWQLIKID